MNTELVKVLEIIEIIESYPGKPFGSLSSFEKMELAITVRGISPDIDYTAIIASVLEIYKDIDGIFTGISLPQKMILAARIGKNETGGNVSVDAIVEAVEAVAASATLTIGGETDSDIAAGDIINIWQVTLTAVADDATPGVFEFCIDDDKDTVIGNIVSAIDDIPGNTGFPFTAEAGDTPTVVFTAKEAGVAGNEIKVSITTEGKTAFDDTVFTNGSDEVPGTAGRIATILINDDDEVFVMTNSGYKEVTIVTE